MKRWLGWGGLSLALVALAVWFYLTRLTPVRSVPSPDIAIVEAAATGPQGRPAPGAQNSADVLRQRLSKLPQSSAKQRAATKAIVLADMEKRSPNARWWLLPIDEIHGEIRAAAERGDLKAAYALGTRYGQCSKALEDYAPQKLLAELDQEMEFAGSAPASQGRMENLGNRFSEDLATYDACASLDRATLDESMSWLERAGRGEVKGARLSYVYAWTQQAQRGRNELIADIERVAAQRTLAREWLQQGLAAGDSSALDQYIEAYSGQGGLLPRDRVQEMAYRYARDLVRGRRGSEFDALWASGPTRFGKDLTSQQWDAAEAQGRSIFKTYYEARPIRPQ
ncbi:MULTISPECIES: hypothetical protein [unclassified Lysobacter]|uniref:hypothetical protein n=1 Tax=unclassified Lysobacter TaxID=2635362 RepID=UPI001BE52D05|nr:MULTISPECIES: hypothetical protein [unclassified Lysobacter]MBT2747670.1 hypothetical protein [Lysobacter sp. ISL-42]MBT2752849.1 hypothetical protein [Lysobacter sp. ISL-50]MBT2779733.1 hypothetical protein [Lysobacter sp. ISL-54]MBT2780088.1 hypothetical protein [Lysobacter sp. ISL-52]